MDSNSDPTPQQLGTELSKLVYGGLGRPLRGGATTEDISGLVAIAQEMATDQNVALEALIAEVVVVALRRLPEEEANKKAALAHLLWIDDLDKPPVQLTKRSGKERKHVQDREEAAVKAAGYAADTFRRYKRPEYLQDLAERILALLTEHRNANGISSLEPESQSAPELPDVAARKESHRLPRLLVGAVGAALVVVGLVWIIAVATGAIG